MDLNLNEERERMGISIEVMADYLGMSYIFLANIFQGKVKCSKEKRKAIEFFLIKTYTERIENAVL